MKAKEYFEEYKKIRAERGWERALVNQLQAIFLEAKEIKKARNARTNKALISIFNELNDKARKFVQLVNEDDKDLKIYPNAFQLFVKKQSPDFAKQLGW